MDTDAAKQRLEAMLAELQRIERSLTGEEQEIEGVDPSDLDQGDAAVQLVNIDRENASLDVVQAQRERVQAALQRIADGSYGKCIDCGQPLPPERLEARPEAARCVADQRKAEAAGVA